MIKLQLSSPPGHRSGYALKELSRLIDGSKYLKLKNFNEDKLSLEIIYIEKGIKLKEKLSHD